MTAPNPIDVTPGKQTSEFSNTRLAQIVSAVVLLIGLIHPGFKVPAEVQAALVVVLGAAIPLLSGWYAKQRKDVKVGVARANATIMSARTAGVTVGASGGSGGNVSVNWTPAPSELPELTDDVNDSPEPDTMLERAANAGAVEPAEADPPLA